MKFGAPITMASMLRFANLANDGIVGGIDVTPTVVPCFLGAFNNAKAIGCFFLGDRR
jgi:hypothetical protein